jgi:peptidoglycan/LPS O-acetylase OafA/YrhL
MMAIATAQSCTVSVAQNSVITVAHPRIPELDGLRGAAILSVMVFHYLDALTSGGRGVLGYFHSVVTLGWTGVDLFFVLSGFLIGGILLDARSSPCYFKAFYVRRFYRIIPLYYVWICGYTMLVALGATRLMPAGIRLGTRPPLYIYFLFLQNVRVFHTSGVGAAWFGATWSLAVEEQFYLIIPLLIWLLPRRTLSVVLSGVVLCAPLLRFAVHNSGQSGPALVNDLMPCRADAFAMGILAAILWRNAKIRVYLAANSFVLYVLLGASLSGFVAVAAKWQSRPWSLGMQTIGLSAIAFFFVVTLLFVLLRPAGMIASVARMRWVREIGVVSYCMYLIHLAIWGACHDLLVPATLRDSGSWLGVCAALLAGVLTYAIAKMSWDWFEKPLVLQGHSYHY